MGRLDLRFEKNLGSDIELGVIANVRQIGTPDGRFPEKPYLQDHVIPAGKQLGLRIDVPEGTYQIDARLPSGEVVSRVETVAAGHGPVPVIFAHDESTGDWLDWQRLLGHVPPRREYEAWLNQIVEAAAAAARKAGTLNPAPRRADQTLINTIANALRSAAATIAVNPAVDLLLRRLPLGHPVSPEAEHAPPSVDATIKVEDTTDQKPVFELWQWDFQPADAQWTAMESQDGWYNFRASAQPSAGCSLQERDARGIISLWTIMQNERLRPVNGRIPRVAAVVRHAQDVHVAMVPIPWPFTTAETAPPIEIYHDGSKPDQPPVLAVRDRNLGTLLAYMNNKRLGDASRMLYEAGQKGLVEDLIEEKRSNPLAACAAAYVGLATLSESSEPPRWAPWLRNIADRFNWLPDGAIVHAAYLLQAANTQNDLDEALRYFKEAYGRGIPFYAAGVPQLMNGLYSFSAKDAEAHAMHERLSRIGFRVDSNQTFTVVTVPASRG